MKKFFLFLSLILSVNLFSQTNIAFTDSTVAHILLGKYNPLTYYPSTILNQPDTIFKGINARISPDSLKSYIYKLAAFHNRNTISDTVSQTHGIGAARRWVYSKFQQYSYACQNRLLPAYLQFTFNIDSVKQHRNVVAILPGIDTTDKSIIIIEGHLDSRCANNFDTVSKAEGVEDNASGAALVMELARVMCKYSYNNTIVFMATTGEEQGLYGANAFAIYAKQKGIKIKAVLNNDVIGGIICGYTSSAPSCPGYGNLDSTQVRIFSLASFNSPHKGLARYTKLQYKENLLPTATVPMLISIMTPQDRTGRGGDHEPFNSYGFTAIRFTSANEDGDANVTDTAYKDRQHTSRDSIGTFKKNSTSLTPDSLFINFPYLTRNAVINGNAAGMLAIGPYQPDIKLTTPGPGSLIIQITKQTQYKEYRIGLRSTTNDWDSVYTMTGKLIDTINGLSGGTYYVSAMSDDTNNIESLPSTEYTAKVTGIGEVSAPPRNIELLQNKPNPFDIATCISVQVNDNIEYKNAYILITDIKGAEIKRIPIKLNKGVDEVLFDHGYHPTGIYIYTLYIDGQVIESKRMVFAN
ncbi:MAG TPA: M28 family peptidase [Bacteroidia bacterium]|jgi:Zn-dependent M28 family amino/carboxypeptidase|nr:M28 family peptidase [Bacteroidia bacterium]